MRDEDLGPDNLPNPVIRHAHILVRIEEAQERLEALRLLRARTVREVSDLYGPTKAARLLGMSRVSLYRIVGQIPEIQQSRSEARLDAATRLFEILAATAAAAEAAAPRAIERGGESNE